jgi:hypothetical protein
MVTDAAPSRYRRYHTTEDTPENVSCDFLAKVIDALEQVASNLGGSTD